MRRFYSGDLIKDDIAVFHQRYPNIEGAKRVAKGMQRICPHGRIHIRRGGYLTVRVNCAAESWAMTTFVASWLVEKSGEDPRGEHLKRLDKMMNDFTQAGLHRQRITTRRKGNGISLENLRNGLMWAARNRKGGNR